jgi:hypothetical protein
MLYVFLINVAVNVQKSFSFEDDWTDQLFFSVIACSLLLRQNSFFTVCAICLVSLVSYFQLALGHVIYRRDSN